MADETNIPGTQDGTTTVLDREKEIKLPPKYAVFFHNDDYTPMEFVVELLMSQFNHNEETAVMIMLEVHHQETGLAGIYTKEIAETKVAIAKDIATKEEHPLLITMEPILDD